MWVNINKSSFATIDSTQFCLASQSNLQLSSVLRHSRVQMQVDPTRFHSLFSCKYFSLAKWNEWRFHGKKGSIQKNCCIQTASPSDCTLRLLAQAGKNHLDGLNWDRLVKISHLLPRWQNKFSAEASLHSEKRSYASIDSLHCLLFFWRSTLLAEQLSTWNTFLRDATYRSDHQASFVFVFV